MKAIRIHGRGGPDHLVYEDVPRPRPGPGEVLVRVHAAGIIANELKWDETYQTTAATPRPLPIPGRDLSGVVEQVGPGVTTLVDGSEVYAMLGYGRDGANADYAIGPPNELAPKPGTLDHVQAAAVPLSALTAWKALFDHAHLAAGQTALIHGGSGASESLLSSLLIGRARRSSLPPRHTTSTSCASWELTRSSTTPRRASNRWCTVSIWSSIWLAARHFGAPGR